MWNKWYASCSGGKDSVAMIDRIINETNMSIDEIVFAAVEKEFSSEKAFRKKLIKRWEKKGIKCVVLRCEDNWDDWFYGKNTKGKAKGKRRGFPLTAYACWWSRQAKFKVLDRYMKDGARYIGIAYDEPKRYHAEMKEQGYFYPLVTRFQMTEDECMKYCKDNGILNPLYEFFDRLGCYLCPKQPKKSLISLCANFPNEWLELKRYARDTVSDEFTKTGQFNTNYNYHDLLEIEKQVKGNI